MKSDSRHLKWLVSEARRDCRLALAALNSRAMTDAGSNNPFSRSPTPQPDSSTFHGHPFARKAKIPAITIATKMPLTTQLSEPKLPDVRAAEIDDTIFTLNSIRSQKYFR